MSGDFWSNKKIGKTRKDHKCEFCNRTIPKGSTNILYWSGKFGGEFQSSYGCNWCEKHEDRLVDDGYISDFWDCIREDIFEELFIKYNYCDECESEIDADIEGDWLIFKCEECGKVMHKEYMPVNEGVNDGI